MKWENRRARIRVGDHRLHCGTGLSENRFTYPSLRPEHNKPPLENQPKQKGGHSVRPGKSVFRLHLLLNDHFLDAGEFACLELVEVDSA